MLRGSGRSRKWKEKQGKYEGEKNGGVRGIKRREEKGGIGKLEERDEGRKRNGE